MAKVQINVDWDGNYGAATANEDIAVVVTAKTLEGIKQEFAGKHGQLDPVGTDKSDPPKTAKIAHPKTGEVDPPKTEQNDPGRFMR